MTRAGIWMLVALCVAGPLAYLAFRLARALGFLDPPLDEQQGHRRTIVVAIYAILIFLPVLIYGFEKGWPRAWIIFGIVNGLALLFFAAGAVWAGLRLRKLRNPGVSPSVPGGRPPETPPADLEIKHPEGPLAELEASREESPTSG